MSISATKEKNLFFLCEHLLRRTSADNACQLDELKIIDLNLTGNLKKLDIIILSKFNLIEAECPLLTRITVIEKHLIKETLHSGFVQEGLFRGMFHSPSLLSLTLTCTTIRELIKKNIFLRPIVTNTIEVFNSRKDDAREYLVDVCIYHDADLNPNDFDLPLPTKYTESSDALLNQLTSVPPELSYSSDYSSDSD